MKKAWQIIGVLALIITISLILFARENTPKEIFQINKEKIGMESSAGKIRLSPVDEAGLVAYYKFEGNANDELGISNGSLNGGMNCNQQGKIGNACYFDGSNDYISIASTNRINAYGKNKISVLAWVKYENDGMIIGKRNNMNSAGYIFTASGSIARVWNQPMPSGGNVPQPEARLSSLPCNNRWHLMALVYNENNDGKVKIYVDGVEGSYSINRALTGNTNDDSAIPMLIGRDGYDNSNAFKGMIDELKVYNLSLTSVEIKQKYDNEKGHLIAYYPFDNDLKDYARCYDGTCSGASCPVFVPANRSNGAKLNGASKWISLPNIIETNNAEQLTIAYWVNVSYGGPIIDKSGLADCGTTPLYVYNLVNKIYENSVSFLTGGTWGGARTSGDPENVVYHAYASFPNSIKDKWQNIIQVYNGSGRTVQEKYKVYLNGIPLSVSGSMRSRLPGLGSQIVLGFERYYSHLGYSCSGTTPSGFAGTLDELKIYDKALNETEVQCLYRNNNIICGYIPLQLIITSPLNQTYNTNSILFNISANNNLSSCVVSLNNWLTNYTMSISSSDITADYINISIADGNYNAKFWCNDTSGIINGLEARSFSINTSVPTPPTNITRAYWANMNNLVIGNADLNDRVKLVVDGVEFAGKEINFTIYKNLLFWFDRKIALSNNYGFTTWIANESGAYYFKAITSDGSSEERTSNNLVVSNNESNSAPIAKIINPRAGSIYFVSEQVNYTQNSSDEDDYFNYTWIFEDGTTIGGSTRNYINHNTTKAYSSDGEKETLLSAVDERGASSRDRASVLIVNYSANQKSVFASIANPRLDEFIASQTAGFNATTSYAIELTNGIIKCIAGNCPASTNNGTLVYGTPNWTGFENMNFNWTFDDSTKKEGLGINNALFDKQFAVIGKHWARLNVSYGKSAKTYTNFTLVFSITNPTCYKDNGQSYWIENSVWRNSTNDCYRANGDNMKDCCSAGYSCNRNNNKCELSSVSVCFDYKTQTNCEAFSTGIAENDLKTNKNIVCGSSVPITIAGVSCSDSTANCRCYWNSSANNGNGQCDSAFSSIRNCNNGTLRNEGECRFVTLLMTNCSNGNRHINWNYVWTGNIQNKPASCIDGEKTIPCLSESLLPFFTIKNLLVALIVIGIIYAVLSARKKKSRRSGKITRKNPKK